VYPLVAEGKLSTMLNMNSKKRALDEADAWVVRLHSDRLSERDCRRFAGWLEASQEHRDAFEQVLAVWGELDLLKKLPLPQPARPRRLSNGWIAGLACAGLLAIFAVFLHFSPAGLPLAPIAAQKAEVLTYSTAVGEQRSVKLPDGSIIELNTHTRVAVEFSEHQRKVTLLEGEAFFNVAKDKTRPFVVDLGKGVVVAVGTAFNICLGDDGATVTVTEGTVKVAASQNAETSSSVEYVSADHAVKFQNGIPGAISSANTQSSIAWRDKLIVFDNTPLPVALREVGRYLPYEVSADLSDDGMAQMRVSGTFSLESPEQALDAIVTTFNLSKLDTSDGIQLHRVH